MSISANCERNGQRINCNKFLLPGTKAYILCRTGYTIPKTPIKNELTCLLSGEWSHPAHQCEPVNKTVIPHTGGLFFSSFFKASTFSDKFLPHRKLFLPKNLGYKHLSIL